MELQRIAPVVEKPPEPPQPPPPPPTADRLTAGPAPAPHPLPEPANHVPGIPRSEPAYQPSPSIRAQASSRNRIPLTAAPLPSPAATPREGERDGKSGYGSRTGEERREGAGISGAFNSPIGQEDTTEGVTSSSFHLLETPEAKCGRRRCFPLLLGPIRGARGLRLLLNCMA